MRYTRDQFKCLSLVSDDDADTILQIINEEMSETEKETYIRSIGAAVGEQMVEEYQCVRDRAPRLQEQARPQENAPVAYPFLQGADATLVAVVSDILGDAGISEQEKYDAMRNMLDPQQFQAYLRGKTAAISPDTFLDLLTPGIRNMALQKLNEGKLDELKLLVKHPPQAAEAFQLWMDAQGARGTLAPQQHQQQPPPLPVKKTLSQKVDIPSTCVTPRWNAKFNKWNREFGVKISMTNQGDKTAISVIGEPKKCLECVIEVFAFLQKSMPSSQYLPDYLEKMVRTKWDLQKRISFMKKTMTDIWVTEENGNNVAKLNAFSQEELNAALSLLKEEYDIIMMRENGSPAPLDRSPAQSQTQLSPPPPRFKTNFSKYPDTMNILILGESGVGKTTLINSIANYAFYETFAEAKQGQPHILIQSYMEMYDQKGYHKQVRVDATVGGNPTENHRTSVAQSDTQHTTSYFLEYQCGSVSKKIRIIDTPGISDTMGFKKDKENMESIIDHLKDIDKLHAILLLMKPNEAKLSIPIKFCLRELLTRLHVDATKVINFCFTRGTATGYRPGETRSTLNVLLDEVRRLQGVQIPLNNDNMYTFENNGLNALCSLTHGYPLAPDVLERAAESWQHSAQETRRLFTKILSNEAHKLEDTLIVNRVRDVINSLARPMAQVARQQLVNKRSIKEKLNEIEMCKGEVERLQGRLRISQTALRAVELDKPQTVCTAPSCTEYKLIGTDPDGDRWPVHNTTCHENCHLTGIQVMVHPNEGLKGCWAFHQHGINRCSNSKCNCGWETHQHIRFKIEPYEAMVIDRNAKNECQTQEQLQKVAQEMVQELKLKDEELTRSNKQLLRAGADFAVFLKTNSIMNHNDAYLEYIYKAIDEEKKKEIYTGERSRLLIELKQYRDEYVQVVNLVSSNVQNGISLSVADIEQSILDLKNHPQYGKFVRDAERLELSGASAAQAAEEKRIVSERPFTFMME